jgi:hypothetical protein
VLRPTSPILVSEWTIAKEYALVGKLVSGAQSIKNETLDNALRQLRAFRNKGETLAEEDPELIRCAAHSTAELVGCRW